ncbi:FG-GAP repeat protein [Streptomyces sp. NPDC085866]|uniref:FG-GAP repeat protein n=2 Tax=unclassified Streptomyces TaxID=2593676 RepID=UPI0037D4C15A
MTFGTANGPGTKTQFIDQSSPGVPGTDETDDDFGTVRTAADFNGEGYGDLAVSAPHEDDGSHKDEGAVTVLWGSRTGLSGGTAVPNKGSRGSYDDMGNDTATDDFNGDGKQDLAVAPWTGRSFRACCSKAGSGFRGMRVGPARAPRRAGRPGPGSAARGAPGFGGGPGRAFVG